MSEILKVSKQTREGDPRVVLDGKAGRGVRKILLEE
jgi:hypothetical protein